MKVIKEFETANVEGDDVKIPEGTKILKREVQINYIKLTIIFNKMETIIYADFDGAESEYIR